MNYIITRDIAFFEKIGDYNYCDLIDMELPDKIALDTETTGLKARHEDFFCVQIGTGKDNYIIHMYDVADDGDFYTFMDLAPYLDDKILVFHNALFDLGFMYKYNYFPREVRDTMLASKILYNGQFEEVYGSWRPVMHNFGSCMNRELNIVYDKTTQKNIHLIKLSTPATITYSFNDVDKLLKLEDVLCEKLEANGQMATYLLHCRYIRSLAYMEQCGLPINSKRWEAKMEEDLKNRDIWQGKIEEYIYDTLPKFANGQIDMFDTKKRILVKITSPKQMVEVFNAYDINTLDKDGKDSIKEDVINKTKHPFVKMWLKYQGAKHRVTTFGRKIYDQIEGERVYSNFNPMVDTARLSSRKGNINFLNFSSDQTTRECFQCDEDHLMIVCDWSGQETVIAADFSGDEAMTKSVVEGADLHSLLARVLFPELADLDDETIMTVHKDKRTASKAPRFAMSYGGNAYTLHVNEGIPMERAQEIEAGFKALHEGLYDWGNMVFIEAVAVGYIQSVDGWRLALPKFDRFLEMEKEVKSMTKADWSRYSLGKKESAKLKKDEEYVIKEMSAFTFYRSKVNGISRYFKLKSEYMRLCLNSPVQTAGSHQLKLAKAMLFDWIIENSYQWVIKICNSVHDEIILEVEKGYEVVAKAELERCMIEGGNHYLDHLEIKADAHVGDTWYEAK